MNASAIRTRWAAIGAAVAISLGAGGIGLISAAPLSSGERPVLVPVNCRLADTRPAPDTVGPRTSPLGPAETYTLSAHGTNGNCTLPADATALLLNVTALNITAPLTFLTLWNADQAQPLTSSLNPAAGQPPTPNAVTVDLSATGQFKLFNALGTLNVIVDVNGYYIDHQHTGADIIDGTITNADTSNEPGVVFNFNGGVTEITGTASAVVSTAMRVPSDGYVDIEVTGNWSGGGGTDRALCQLQKGAIASPDFSQPAFELNDPSGSGSWLDFSAHRTMEISAADNPFLLISGQALSLVCREVTGSVTFDNVNITATFYASSYRPLGIIILPFTADDGGAGAPGS